MPRILTFYGRLLALGVLALGFSFHDAGVTAQKANPAPDPGAQPAPDPNAVKQDEFKAAKKNYEAAKKEESPSGMRTAIEKIAATGIVDAAKYLIKELADDQNDRKRGRPGLKGDLRKRIVGALSKFTQEECVAMIGEAALKLNSNPDAKGEERLALDQFDFFLALARMGDSPAADATIRSAIADPKNAFVKVAAIEAARQAMARRFAPDVVKVLAETNEAWFRQWNIVPINVFACLETLIEPGNKQAMLEAVEATIAYEERVVAVMNEKSDERVRYFGGRMLHTLTGEFADMARPDYWRWWIRQFKELGKRPPDQKKAEEKRSKTVAPPPIFDAPPVGRRFVFIIDVSDSMKEELKITIDDIEKRRKKRDGPITPGKGEKSDPPPKDGGGEEPKPDDKPPQDGDKPKEGDTPPPPGDKPAEGQAGRKFQGDPAPQGGRGEDSPLRKLPWKDIHSKIELAREELSRGIKSLAVTPAKGAKVDREFAIITYSTEVNCITEGWITATAENCDKWAAKARQLEVDRLTNIHGALMKGMRVNAKNQDAAEPSVDRDCVLTGADSIIFLTDGWASWSDQSVNQNVKDPRGGKGMIGDGPFIMGEDIWPEIVRQNIFRKVIIHTVGIGNHDFRLLRELAKHTGGTYVDWKFEE